MNNLTITEGTEQLTLESREVAEMVGKRHTDLMRSINGYVKVLTDAKMRSLDFFIPSDYVDAKGESRSCYLLTKKGCDMVANKMTGEKGILFTATYINRFEEMAEELKNQTPKLPTTYKQALLALVEEVEKNEQLELENKQQAKEIEYKQNVIQAFSDDITLTEKRQILNDVVRRGGVSKISDRWRLLYKNYQTKHKFNLTIQLENYNKKNKPKMKNKLDYIDKVRDDIDGLYEIACKLFESDIEKLVEEIYELRKSDTYEVTVLN